MLLEGGQPQEQHHDRRQDVPEEVDRRFDAVLEGFLEEEAEQRGVRLHGSSSRSWPLNSSRITSSTSGSWIARSRTSNVESSRAAAAETCSRGMRSDTLVGSQAVTSPNAASASRPTGAARSRVSTFTSA